MVPRRKERLECGVLAEGLTSNLEEEEEEKEEGNTEMLRKEEMNFKSLQ